MLAYNTISTGDDHIAIKGGHGVSNIYVAHNHFGTGHGMSIGSETYGGVNGLTVYDLTIDADSRPVGEGASPGDFNGIRVKSDASRGGLVDNVVFRNVCMRDVNNAILDQHRVQPALLRDAVSRNFKSLTFQNIHDVTCLGAQAAGGDAERLLGALPGGTDHARQRHRRQHRARAPWRPSSPTS